MLHIKNSKDFFAGLVFLFFGIGAMVFATGYQIGTAARMGPGYFPFLLGGVLLGLGLAISLRSLSWGEATRKKLPWAVKPALFVLSSVILFGLLLRPLGLLLSTVILILVSSMASHEFRLKESILNAFALLFLVLVIFVYFLSFQIPLWPSFLGGRT